jgi:O-glycosyl hydrolase
MYRNYDGHKSVFGDVSVSDVVPDPDAVASFAAVRRSDHALTVMVINKAPGVVTPIALALSHFAAGHKAQAWRLTSSDTITRLPDVPVMAGRLTAILPAQSVTLFVVSTTGTQP